MKRTRVRAQRKFAAGIQIPVPVNTRSNLNNTDRRTETPPESRVFQVHSTPRAILDVVSFQGIHTHLQPVVLLKRLKETPNTNTESEIEPDELRECPKTRRIDPIQNSTVLTKKQKINQNCSKKKTISTSHSLIDKEAYISITPLPDRCESIADENTNEEDDNDDKPIITNIITPGRKRTRNGTCPSRLFSSVKEIICFRSDILSKRCQDCGFCFKINLVLKTVDAMESCDFNELFGTDSSIENMIMYMDLTEENGRVNITDEQIRLKCAALMAKKIKKRAASKSNKNPQRRETICGSSCESDLQRESQVESEDEHLIQSNIFNPHLEQNANVSATDSDAVDFDMLKSENRCHSEDNLKDTTVTDKEMSNGNMTQPELETLHWKSSQGEQMSEDANSNSQSIECGQLRISPDTRSDTPGSTSSDDIVLSKKKNEKGKAQMRDAPVFRPTREEFTDPMKYFESILPEVTKFGLCKVIPPDDFDPPCVLDSDIRFGTTSQYIARMYQRWGPATRELCTIRAHLASQKVQFNRPPLLEGLEVNLPKLFGVVQRLGGLKHPFTKNKWLKIAEELRYKNLGNPGKRLDQVYVKFLLPYEALTNQERKKLIDKVNRLWKKRYQCMLERASNPLQRQKRMLEEADSSGDDDFYAYDGCVYEALSETEDCVISGRNMSLKLFKKVAESAMRIILGKNESDELAAEVVEDKYWDLVLSGTDHVCVYAASVDTGEANLGFPNNDNSYTSHPWNLKRLSENPRNVLSFLGPVVGMTVPTLHIGMVFSTSCWHRDPHGLPWIEFMHEGSEKIWYGIPDDQSGNFREAVEKLCPTFSQNKSIWLPSDITMIPPDLLKKFDISMCRATQKPGEYIIVCPKAYSCSIATSFTISESVYFATQSWLEHVHAVFQELGSSCEPTMFSLEQLLLSFVKDHRTPLEILKQIYPVLNEIIEDELTNRRGLKRIGYKGQKVEHKPVPPGTSWNVRDHDECEICRMTLYLSKVKGLFNKASTLCLEHGLKVLKKKRRPKSIISIDFMYSTEELEDILSKLRKRLKP